ncbi:hypothetical protein [Anaerospora sp.]|uniref:hypothetical protein n=1 Tax=Anaerospora sp. TaxID=1960278 RepID=UPI00289CCF40|nr:hypothetical protein [Anaerospora sp.]
MKVTKVAPVFRIPNVNSQEQYRDDGFLSRKKPDRSFAVILEKTLQERVKIRQ